MNTPSTQRPVASALTDEQIDVIGVRTLQIPAYPILAGLVPYGTELRSFLRQFARAIIAALSTAPSPAVASSTEPASHFEMTATGRVRVDAAADALSKVLAFVKMPAYEDEVARALSGLRAMQSLATLTPAVAVPAPIETAEVPKGRVFIDMDGVIVDFEAHMNALGMSGDECKRHPGAYRSMPAIPGALAAVRRIIGAGFEVWIATKPPTGIPLAYSDKAAWVMEHLPELTRRIIVTHHKGMLGRPGDWLIDDRPHKAHCEEFAGTLIPFAGTTGTGWPEALAVLGIGLATAPPTLARTQPASESAS